MGYTSSSVKTRRYISEVSLMVCELEVVRSNKSGETVDTPLQEIQILNPNKLIIQKVKEESKKR